MYKKAFPSRCNKCKTRKTFKKHPEFGYQKPKRCQCKGFFQVDKYRLSTENKKNSCHCSGWLFPHRRGCKWCTEYKGSYTNEEYCNHFSLDYL